MQHVFVYAACNMCVLSQDIQNHKVGNRPFNAMNEFGLMEPLCEALVPHLVPPRVLFCFEWPMTNLMILSGFYLLQVWLYAEEEYEKII